MPREVKHGRHAFLGEAGPSAQDGRPEGGAPGSPSLPRRRVTARWFAALGPAGAVPVERAPSVARRPRVLAPLVLGAALLAAALAALHFGMGGGLVPLALVLTAAVVLWRFSPRVSAGSQREAAGGPLAHPPQSRGLELDCERLAFRSAAIPGALTSGSFAAGSFAGPLAGPLAGSTEPDGADTLVRLDAPFGVTLLASPRRDRVLALFSSASGTFYLGAAFDAAARRAFAPLLDRSFTVVGDDAGMDAIGPDGEPLVLAPDELASLLDALVEQSPTCLERFVLTDARGAALTLDGRHLCIGDRAVDLTAPLEWRSIVFQEAFGQVIAVYQGTWIRQSTTELTLVSLLPALGPALGSDLDVSSLDRAVLRDLRLMQASPEPPPPNEQRIAIDRLFMLQVRSALDRAPRASHQPDRAQA